MVNFPSETAPCVPAHKVIYPKYYKHWLYSGPIHWIVWFIAYFDPKNYFLRPILVWIFYLFCLWKFEKKVKSLPWRHNPPKNKTNKIHLRFYSNWEKQLWPAHKTRQMNELVFDSSIVCLLWGCPGLHCLANFGDINHSVQSRLAQNGVSFKIFLNYSIWLDS